MWGLSIRWVPELVGVEFKTLESVVALRKMEARGEGAGGQCALPRWCDCLGRPAGFDTDLVAADTALMSHSVRTHLRLEIDDYDEKIRRWIPGYEMMIGTAAEAVAEISPDLVIDIGSGTGALAEAILERDSVGAVQLLDIDPEMLEHGASRVARFGARARPTLQSYDDAFESCDAFSASLSLHHIPTLGGKTDLFRRAFAALRPGGVLVNGDINMPADPDEARPLYSFWAEHQMENGISEEQAWAHFDVWAGEDTYLPLEDELTALRAVGFNAARVWNEGPVGVVVARKPSPR